MRTLIRFLLRWEYSLHKVDEYLARQRDDYKSASWSLNRALRTRDLINQL